jgi:uncharacterized protein
MEKLKSDLLSMKNYGIRNLFAMLIMKQDISDFFVSNHGLETVPQSFAMRKIRQNRIKELLDMGLFARDDKMSFYLNDISPACDYCKRGYGPTISITDNCNRKCFYCFENSIHSDQSGGYISGIDTDKISIDMQKRNFADNIINLGISGGEPLLVFEAVIKCLLSAKNRKKHKVITRLYTNGDLLDKGRLDRLREAGLDEIRFGIKKDCLQIINKIKLAKKYIPRVLMEGPVFPGDEKRLKKLLLTLDDIGIFGINMLDLRCRCNISAYKSRGYKFAYKEKHPFYENWFVQGWPIHGSEETIFKLLKFTIQKKLRLSVLRCYKKMEHSLR